MSETKIQTRRLTVNAAFLKDIKDDNRDLKHLLDRMIPLAEHPQTAKNHWIELVELFANLRDQLALHFSLEEAYGYFDDAVVSAPQLSTSAECLRAQHPQLFQSICKLADKSGDVSSDDDENVAKCLSQFSHFRNEFEKHEEAELKLILDALDDDIGVGD